MYFTKIKTALVPLLAVVLLGATAGALTQRAPAEGEGKKVPPASAPAAVPAPEEGPRWGSVKGRVVWEGEKVPPREKLKVDRDRARLPDGTDLLSEELLIDPETRGVRNVFVWLAPDPAGGAKAIPVHPDRAEVPKAEVVLRRVNGAFVPHAVALRQGQDLVVENGSPVALNFRWEPVRNNADGNVLIPPGGSHTIRGLKAEFMPMTASCDIQIWMSARIGVFDHPYFALTGADGRFEIELAPAGRFRLFAWHEKYGWVHRGGKAGQPVVIPPGGADLGKIGLKE